MSVNGEGGPWIQEEDMSGRCNEELVNRVAMPSVRTRLGDVIARHPPHIIQGSSMLFTLFATTR